MPRRSLRPHLNQIRGWVRQGRTDAWIAHQLEATVQQIEAFKRENELVPSEAGPASPGAEPGPPADFGDEIDLRAEDDAAIAAELEAAEVRRLEDEKEAEEAARLAAEAQAEEARARAERNGDADDVEGADDGEEAADNAPKRRRGRRGGRGRRARTTTTTFEGTFDHGDEGYGLWLDPAVADSGVYAEHWAGHRPVEVVLEEDQIVIRRTGADAGDGDEDDAE
ncbi:MAG: hypothetical protein H0U79_02825 [Solirubrobacterales bacterium]|nr:hypothetical protein [Solirubrobacterales bacterium]